MNRFLVFSIFLATLLAAVAGCGQKPRIIKTKYLGFNGIESEMDLFALADTEPPLMFEPRFLYTRAAFFYGQNQLDSAALALTEAVSLSPSEWRLYFLLGRVESRRHRWDYSEQSYQTALKFAPQDKEIRALIYAAVAESLENQHDYTRARQHYATALNLDPECKHARSGMERLMQLSAARD